MSYSMCIDIPVALLWVPLSSPLYLVTCCTPQGNVLGGANGCKHVRVDWIGCYAVQWATVAKLQQGGLGRNPPQVASCGSSSGRKRVKKIGFGYNVQQVQCLVASD